MGVFGYSLATDYWIVSMFELNLKNTFLRSKLKFHNYRLTTTQVIVGTLLKNIEKMGFFNISRCYAELG
jgi:hypothetical protein